MRYELAPRPNTELSFVLFLTYFFIVFPSGLERTSRYVYLSLVYVHGLFQPSNCVRCRFGRNKAQRLSYFNVYACKPATRT